MYNSGVNASEYRLMDLASIKATDVVVITMTKDGTTYALTSVNGSSDAPTAEKVTVSNGVLISEISNQLMWHISGSSTAYIISTYDNSEAWLYSTTSNNGIRVGSNTANTFIIDEQYGYLFNVSQGRYVGVYNDQDWRSYTSMHANIAGQTLGFYVLVEPSYSTSVCVHEDKKTTDTWSCTEDGEIIISCNDCGVELSRETKTAPGHNYEDGICSRCQTPEHTCDYSFKVEITPPTCMAGGYTTRSCSCGESEVVDNTEKVNCVDNNNDCKCDFGCGTITNYGTKENPLTTTLALGACSGFNPDDVSEECFYVTGVVTKIGSTGDYYQNVYITDGTKELLIYKINMGEGISGFKIGDTIIAYGYIKNYNGTIEMAPNGSTYVYVIEVIDPCANGHDYANATCKAPKTCKNCGATDGEIGNHSYVDGICSVCGAVEGVETETATLKYSGTTTTNMTGNNDATILGLDATIFTVIGNKGGTNNNCGLNKDGGIRLYGSSSDGNGSYFTVTVAQGYTIQSIKVTFKNTTNNKNCQLTVGETSTIFDGSSATWEMSINSNTFKLQNVITGSTTQIYIESIEITYYVSGEVCEHTNTITTITTPATCGTDGVATVTCKDCGVTIGTNTIPATGVHSYTAYGKDATNHWNKCGTCGYEDKTTTTAHTYTDGSCVCGATESTGGETTPVETTMNIYGTTGTKGTNTISWTSEGVTFTNNKTSNSSAILSTDSTLYRIYANSEVVISSTKMTKIVITATSGSYATVLKDSISATGYDVTVSGSVVTITLNSVDSITFTASAQARINKIVVTHC